MVTIAGLVLLAEFLLAGVLCLVPGVCICVGSGMVLYYREHSIK